MTLVTTSQRPDIAAMQVRLKRDLSDNNVRFPAADDLTDTLVQIGLPQDGDSWLVSWMLSSLELSKDLEYTEHIIHSHLRRMTVNGEPMLHVVEKMLAGRAQLIFEQVRGFFTGNNRILDMGCGDGQVTNLLSRYISLQVEGYDVKDYVLPGMMADKFGTYDGKVLPVENGRYDEALMTNVAHHSSDNAQLLRELSRVIRPGGLLVVIETVPTKDDPVEFERTFISDYVYNRLFHTADVPVPGTYETAEGWVKRFKEVGFELLSYGPDCVNPAHLGYDQPLIKDWHVLYAFRKV